MNINVLKRWANRHRPKVAAGVVATALGLTLTITAVQPGAWSSNLEAWGRDLKKAWLPILVFLGGAILGWLSRSRSRSHSVIGGAVEVISALDFEDRFDRCMAANSVRVIKVFGYTQETMSDYLRFDHRKRPVEMRVLNRSWLAEQEDEEQYNQAYQGQGLRPWRKARSIFAGSTRDLPPGALKRLLKYYEGPPVIKAVLICTEAVSEAFISFYEWQDSPADGGSPFKGADRSMVHLRAATPEAEHILRYLDSQFEYLWSLAKSADELRLKTHFPTEERLASPPTEAHSDFGVIERVVTTRQTSATDPEL